MAKMMTQNQFPPIPTRKMDWVAWFDGYEEDGRYGYGETEAEAIEDLLTEYECPMCGEHVDPDTRYCGICKEIV